MNLRQRFEKLTFWNKLGAIGSLCSVIGLIFAMPAVIDFFKQKDTFNVSIEDRKVRFEKDSEIAKQIDSSMKKSEYDFNYPHVVYRDNTYIENKINNLIQKEYAEWDINLVDIKNSDLDGLFNGGYKVLYKIRNLLGIKLDVYWYSMGAAHGIDNIVGLNVNLENGEIFEFKDLFREKALGEINRLVEKKISTYKECDIPKQEIKLAGDQGFYIKDSGIIIVFDRYEIAAGACGSIEIPVSFYEIRGFVNPNGPLNYLIEN